jgi:hypothetical protein
MLQSVLRLGLRIVKRQERQTVPAESLDHVRVLHVCQECGLRSDSVVGFVRFHKDGSRTVTHHCPEHLFAMHIQLIEAQVVS